MTAILKPRAVVATEPTHKPWWCHFCKAFVDTMDPGDVYPKCEKCHKRSVVWQPDKMKLGPVPAVALPQLPEPPEPRKKQDKRRLPLEKRDLRVMARSGYWFCYGGCQEITEESEEGCCVLCGAALHEDRDRVAPVFQPGDVPRLGADGRYPDKREYPC